MEKIKNYDQFVNEELISKLYNAAKGAFKNFISGIVAPFKNLSKDFKRGMKMEEVKNKISNSLDTLLKNATKSINDAKDEAEITNMKDTFRKQIDEEMEKFDKEIKIIKESKIFEGAVKNAMIGARVLFGIVKNEIEAKKMEFDKKFAAAKELNQKKQVAIEEIKSVVNGFKNKIKDTKLFQNEVEKYKEENNIKEEPSIKVVIEWNGGNTKMELKKIKTSAEGGRGIYNYQVLSTTSKKLKVSEDDRGPDKEVLVIINGNGKIGNRIKLTEIYRGGKEDPLKEYETGNLEKITVDGKTVKEYKFSNDGESESDEGNVDKLKDNLGKIKSDKEKMNIVTKFTDFIQDGDKGKISEIMKIIGG